MPVDEAGLDAFLAAPDAPAEAPAPAVETPAHAAEAVEVPAVEPVAPANSKWDADTEKYIKELRSEAQNYRNRAKQYNDVFEGYEPEAVEEWLSLASTLKADPAAAADRFGELAEAIRGQFTDPAGKEADAAVAAAEDATGLTEEPLTRADLDRIFAERDQKQEMDRLVAKIEVDATALGYQLGTESYDELLFIASRLPSGSIADAHAKMTARNQAIIDKYVADLGGKPAPMIPGNGAPASGETGYKTFEEASSALDAWLANQA